MTSYVIDLHDRPAALERLLNTCRRKGYAIRTLQYGQGGPGLHRVAIELEEGCPPAERVIANLARLHDVEAVDAVDAQRLAGAAESTQPVRDIRAA